MKSKNLGAVLFSALTLQRRKPRPVKSLKPEKAVAEWGFLRAMAFGFLLLVDVKTV